MKIITRGGVIRLAVFSGALVCLCLISLLAMPPSKEKWLRRQAIALSRVQITDEMVAAAKPWRYEAIQMEAVGTPWEGQPDQWRYFLPEDHGVIPVGVDGGVYVVTHSFHDNSSIMRLLLRIPAALITGRRPVAPDATMAVDQQGRLYTCEGHICGGLMLTSKKEVKTLQDFLETYSYDIEQNTWKPYTK